MRKHLVTFRKSGFFLYFRRRNQTDLNAHGNTRLRSGITGFCLVSVDVKKKKKNVDRILSTFRKQVFLLFLQMYSDLHVEGTETLSSAPETRVFQLFSIYMYQALSALVIPDLSFSLQVR